MYSNDEIMKKKKKKDDTCHDESEKECYAFCLNIQKKIKQNL